MYHVEIVVIAFVPKSIPVTHQQSIVFVLESERKAHRAQEKHIWGEKLREFLNMQMINIKREKREMNERRQAKKAPRKHPLDVLNEPMSSKKKKENQTKTVLDTFYMYILLSYTYKYIL